jgi:hypothetical protein
MTYALHLLPLPHTHTHTQTNTHTHTHTHTLSLSLSLSPPPHSSLSTLTWIQRALFGMLKRLLTLQVNGGADSHQDY